MPDRDDPQSAIRTRPSEGASPYTALAAGYDLVMEHVDYGLWAEYAHDLLQRHHPGPETLLELGCGTGTLALGLQPLGRYRYAATDRSPEMIEVARAKAAAAGVPVTFGVADFTDFAVDEPVDAVLLLYDGLNYLLEPGAVRALFRCVRASLRPGGLFLFDQSTPANSLNNEAYFEGSGRQKNFIFTRHSRYDRAARLHTTTFDLVVEGRAVREEHVQRAYALDELRALVREGGLAEVAAYDGFSTIPAADTSERIHWVLRRPL